MSSFTFSNVFNYMHEQYPDSSSTNDGDDILQELNGAEEVVQDDSYSVSDLDVDRGSPDLFMDLDERAVIEHHDEDAGGSPELFMDLDERADIEHYDEVASGSPDLFMNLDERAEIEHYDEVENQVNVTDAEVPKKKYKRYTNPESRKKRDIEKHPLLPSCPTRCVKKCSENISEQMRVKIHEHFWELTKEMQMQWIAHMVETAPPSRPRKRTSGKKERKCTRTFFLEKQDREKVQVCQVMFLRTLGLKNDRSMRTALEKTHESRNTLTKDNRGKQLPVNKTGDEVSEKVQKHIKKYNPCISHYRRAHAPNRLYISPEHTVRSMHSDYIEINPDDRVSYTFYLRKVNQLNISFVKLGEEECEVCEIHTNHLTEDHKISKSEQLVISDDGKKRTIFLSDCSKCSRFQKHIKAAEEARCAYKDEKEREIPAGEIAVSVDMQKVIMLPRLPGIKEAIFCRRLVVFNETFAPIGNKGKMKPVGVLWHEGIKGRSAEDVASTFIAFIRHYRDCKRFIFWADNCSGQNKNWFLYTALVNEANRLNGTVEEITIRYFEPGHTFMSADSFHHQVEKAMKKKKRVEDFEDFVELVNSVGKSLVMDFKDFLDFPRGVSQGKYAQGKPKLEAVQVVRFKKGDDKMFWKNSHTENHFKDSQFLQKKWIKSIGKEFTPAEKPRGVAPQKKESIVSKLTPFLQPSRRAFWESLSVDEQSVDLTTERDENEILDEDA